MSIFRKIKKLFMQIDDGFLPEKPREDDYKIGKSPIEYNIRVFDGDHTDFLPENEWQRRNNVETMSCVSFSANNIAEIQINWMINLRKINVDALEFLSENDYIANGKVNLSDRFLAIMSNTTKNGNYLTKVAQTLRKHGAIPEVDLPFGKPADWAEYHNPAVIDEDMLKLGERFLEYFTIQYEWVVAPGAIGSTKEANRQTVHKHLKHVPLQFAKDGHASSFFDSTDQIRFMQYDSYDPFKKERKWDYDPYYVMKIVVTEKSEFSDDQVIAARKLVQEIIIDQHKEKYFFRAAPANGEAYMVNPNGSFKYGTAKGTIFTQMTIDNTIVPVSPDLWERFRAAEIK